MTGLPRVAFRSTFVTKHPRICVPSTQLKIFENFLKSNSHGFVPKNLYHQIQHENLNLLILLYSGTSSFKKTWLLGIQPNYRYRKADLVSQYFISLIYRLKSFIILGITNQIWIKNKFQMKKYWKLLFAFSLQNVFSHKISKIDLTEWLGVL